MICNRSVDTGLGFAVGGGGGGTGTVTSVAMTVPSILAVGGSPVTTAGTLALTLQPQLQNRVFASPIGSSGVPTFRSIVAEDLNPTYSNGQVLQTNGAGVLSWVTPSGSGTVTSVAMTVPSILAVSGSPITTSGTLALSLVSQSPNHVFASPPGASGLPTFRNLVAEHLNPTYTNGQVLQTNGAGVLSWVNVGGSPGGTTASVQVNNSGVFGGSNLFTYNLADSKLLLTKSSTTATSLFEINNNSTVMSSSIDINHSQTTNSGNIIDIETSANSGTALFIRVNTTTRIAGVPLISTISSNNDVSLSSSRLSQSSHTNATLYLYEEQVTFNAPMLSCVASLITPATNYSNFIVWVNGRTGFRTSRTSAPTNGIIEMPWLSGDTLPTLYVGSPSSNQTAIYVQSSSNCIEMFNSGADGMVLNGSFNIAMRILAPSSIAVMGNNVSTGTVFSVGSRGHVVISNNNNVIGYEFTGGFAFNTGAIFRMNTNTGACGLRVDMQNNTNSNSYTLDMLSNSIVLLRQIATGTLSIRTGLDTTNKVTDVGGQFFTSTSDASNSGTVETDLTAVITPGNILGTDGDRLEIEASFTTAANTNTKNIRLYFGATKIIDVTCANGGTASSVVVNATIIRVNSTTQRCYATSSADVAPSLSNANYTTASEILSGAVTTKFTGQGSASSDITQRTMSIKWFPKGQG